MSVVVAVSDKRQEKRKESSLTVVRALTTGFVSERDVWSFDAV